MKYTSVILLLFLLPVFCIISCRSVKPVVVQESAADLLPAKIIEYTDTLVRVSPDHSFAGWNMWYSFWFIYLLWVIIDLLLKKREGPLSPTEKRVEKAFKPTTFPDKLLSEIFWDFKKEPYSDYKEFIDAVKKYNSARRVYWNPDEYILKCEEVTIWFYYKIGKQKIKKEFSFLPDDMSFKSGELLHKMHIELEDIMKIRRYTLLNYLERINEENPTHPIYRLRVAKNEEFISG